MKEKLILLCLGALALAVYGCSSNAKPLVSQPAKAPISELPDALEAAQSAEGENAVSPSKVTGDSEVNCLDCHGPFKELVLAEASFPVETGGEVNPHKYIAHDTEDVPKCSYCHEPHPLPLTSKEEVSKPDVEWCFTQCHHMRDFRSCTGCH